MYYTRVFPTGTVRYNPDKCWNGLTIIPSLYGYSKSKAAVLYDMNGNVVKAWPGVYGGFDNKMLPGGHIMGVRNFLDGYWLNGQDISQFDWDGNLVWSFDKIQEVKDLKTNGKVWTANLHHDYQREGSPTGYYSPGQLPKERGKTLINSGRIIKFPEFSRDHDVFDTVFMELDEKGNILWQWSMLEHLDELGLEPIAKSVIVANSKPFRESNLLRDIYCNCVSYVGPNKWYDAGDTRFHPDNIITDIRALNVSFIVDRSSGHVVWRMGPDFLYSKELQDIGQIVGQHHFHMIPKGLPGEGNVLIFDNGGEAGIGAPTPCAPSGFYNATRGYSRVLEINPITMKVEWSYNNTPFVEGQMRCFAGVLYSDRCSSADRLPNGNTLITESIGGRAIEVTQEGEIVWEFLNPGHHFFRAHRYPYDWFPLKEQPKEEAVVPPLNMEMRIRNGKVDMVEVDETLFIK